MTNNFLPVCKEDLAQRGIKQLDFVYVCGDAYVDHPSFGAAIICRILELHGYKVGIIPQPDLKDPLCMEQLGIPRLAYLVSSGNMDSMVNHYYVSKKRREKDSYSPGGVMGKRPDYAVKTYCNFIRQRQKDIPIVIGGIEASLRRMAHYDYWSDSLKPSLLLDSKADLISYGMGEKCLVEIADALNSGLAIKDITFIKGTVFATKDASMAEDARMLPSFAELKKDKNQYAKSFLIQKQNNDPFHGEKLAEAYEDVFVIQNPPQPPLSVTEMDDVYRLPFQNTYHPMYEKDGGIPAIEEVKFSIVSNRGCFGSCNFCALAFHQGRIVQVRSHESIINEARRMTKEKDFKGYIHDVGGPTANFRHPACKKQLCYGACKERECLVPSPCKNMDSSHVDYLKLLRKLRELPGIKKVFIRSGIRFDYLLADKNKEFFNELVQHHISGQLKVAPEHVSNRVLEKMGKPEHKVYVEFKKQYERINKKFDKNQFLVPYYMSSHPGCDLNDAVELALYIKETGVMPRQVQDYYPTPSTLSTVMYYTERDPYTMEKIYVAKNPHEKAMQRALMQYKNPANKKLVIEALKKAGREDLIGYGKECLIRPDEPFVRKKEKTTSKQGFGSAKPKKKKTIRNVRPKKK
ncbi:MAG: YgiQ family radical SAM protein [Lachnospiraceae bacterium]|nr:YgiQ family radical SAM protein [Lachnospiraceae bacterium]